LLFCPRPPADRMAQFIVLRLLHTILILFGVSIVPCTYYESQLGATALPSVIGGVIGFHIPSAASIAAITASVSHDQAGATCRLWG
jgi:hypothetical protein